MLTRCPSCATHFRVTADQLKLRAGRVRCGECQHVFSALDTLIEEPPLIIVPSSSGPIDSDHSGTVARDAGQAPSPPNPMSLPADALLATEIAPREALGGDDRTPESNVSRVKSSAGLPESGQGPEPTESVAAEMPGITEPNPDQPREELAPWDDTPIEPDAPSRPGPWVVGCLIALLALGLQAVFAYRVEVAVLLPESRPLLAAVCESLGCEVGLPTKVALVGIEASDLHPDAGQKGRLMLTATLKNRAPFAQQFPHLELTLTDTADKALVRKVLSPGQYLPRGTLAANGMAPNADIAVAVTVDALDLSASGYRLYIFYP